MNAPYPLPVVVIVCGDPGGASAVAPVIEILQADNRVKICTFGYREACSIWSNRGIPFERLSESVTISQAIEKMSDLHASLLLCGTSYNSVELEKRFIAAAKELCIPSLAVLDFWSNYLIRFQDQDGKLVHVPNKIAIMDQLAFNEMSALGFDPNDLIITGQPAFDELTTWRRHLTAERRKTNRSELNIADQEILVLFASQPLVDVFGSAQDNTPQYMGFDEFVVIRALLSVLEDIALRHTQKITLLIRPHPR